MKLIKNLLLIFVVYLITSCSGSDDSAGSSTQNPSDGSSDVTSITLSLNKESYNVGEACFYVVRDNFNSVITDQVIVTVNGTQSSVNPYLFQSPGTYDFIATYDGLTSNIVSVEVQLPSDYSDTSTFDSTGSPSTFTKKALLEDFTGTWCPQCPGAASAVENAVNSSENIYGVAYHDGDPMQISETSFWSSYYHVTGFPTVYVNGPDTRWNYPNMTQINNELSEQATLGLAIEADIIGGKLDLEVKVGFNSTPSEEVRLMIYLVEGSATSSSAQAGSSQGVNYVHNDILREVYTDQLGDVIPSSYTQSGGIYTRTITGLDLPGNTDDLGDLKIIAYIRNTYTKTFTDYFGNVWVDSPHYDIYNLQEVHVGESVSFE